MEPYSAKQADEHDVSPFTSITVSPIDKNPLINGILCNKKLVTEKHLKQKLSIEYDTIREK